MFPVPFRTSSRVLRLVPVLPEPVRNLLVYGKIRDGSLDPRGGPDGAKDSWGSGMGWGTLGKIWDGLLDLRGGPDVLEDPQGGLGRIGGTLE